MSRINLANIFQDDFNDTSQQSNLVDRVDSQAASGQANVVVSNGSQFTIGDQVIIYDGEDIFETATIQSINTNTLTMTLNLTNTYPEGARIGRYLGYLDTTSNKFQRLLAPDLGTGADGAFISSGNATWSTDKNFTSVTILNGHTITIQGNIQIKCQGTFDIQSGGKLSAKGQGHAGGNGSSLDGNYGVQGSSQLGVGGSVSGTGGNGGGGGGGYGTSGGYSGGGGGSYGGAGSSGTKGGGGGGSGGDAGAIYNDAALSTVTLAFLNGSGGGGGGGSGNTQKGNGGAGGGIIRLHCKKLVVAGEIDCDGNAGTVQNGCGGGGGSGGTIFIQAVQLVVAGTSLIHSNGGLGGSSTGSGGNGGVGRIRIEAVKITGTTVPTFATGYINNLGGFTRYSWYTTTKINVLNDTFVANAFVKAIDNVAANPSGSVSSGQKIIGLSSGNAAKFNAGMKVVIYENEKMDIGTINTVGTTSITLIGNLAYSYTTAAVVVRIDVSAQASLVASGANENFQDMDLKEVQSLGSNMWVFIFSKAYKSTNEDVYGKKFVGRAMIQGKDNDAVDVYAKYINWTYF